MTRLFISYSRRDKDFVKVLVEMLREDLLPEPEHSTWYDGRLNGGQHWWREILRQIARSDIFLFMLSEESLRSEYCKAELQEAWRLQKLTLTVQLDSRAVIPSNLKLIQCVDMSSGVDDPAAIRKLVRALRYLESQIPESAPPPRSLTITPLPDTEDLDDPFDQRDDTQPYRPPDLDAQDKLESARLAHRAEKHNQHGNYEQAVLDAQQAIRLDPENIKPYIELGYAYDQQGNYDGAVREFSKARDIAPNQPDIYANLGAVYYDKGDYVRALSEFKRALHLNPHEPCYQDWCVTLQRLMGQDV